MKTEIIAELGSNIFAGSNHLDRALMLTDIAAIYGATTVKYQLFRADRLYRDKEKQDAVRPYELPAEWLPKLKQHAEKKGLRFLVSPFYVEAVDILESLGVERYKIASWELTHVPLLKRIAQTKKPVVMSIGSARPKEVFAALQLLWGNPDITLLACTAGYPTRLEEVNLPKLMRELSQYPVPKIGFSSHMLYPEVIASTVLFGAEVIEVHFDAGAIRGPEAGHSLTPLSLLSLVNMVRHMEAVSSGNMIEMNKFGRDNYYRDPGDWLRPVIQ